MYVYETFTPGTVIGEARYLFDRAALDQWLALFPEDANGETMPPGMVAAVTIRAYMALIDPRPPGNIHAAQNFRIARMPRVGDRLATTIRCAAKELKKGRRWVALETETRDAGDGSPLFSGRMTTVWAA